MKVKIAFLLAICLFASPGFAQDPADVASFDETAEGPWSDVGLTTITAPKVADDGITLDGEVSSGEYGGFEGVDVIPGDNAWILSYAQDKNWESPEDSSFTFYVAYDNDYLYVGLNVMDDVMRSNDPPTSFWKDDAVEIIVDPLDTRYDYIIDNAENPFGGHIYFNYEGKFSEWDEAANAPADRTRWSSLAEWSFGEDAEIYAIGKENPTGWALEFKLHKVTLIDPQAPDFAWEEGQDMAFNVGLDDDDGSEMAIQYWWANRIRAIGATEDDVWVNFSDEEIENQMFLDPDYTIYDLGIDAIGRLSPGAAGLVILGPEAVSVGEWSLF